MAELPLDQAIPRFKANEDRMDRFANGGPTATFLSSGGTLVPSIQKFLADKNTEIDGATVTIYQARDQAALAKQYAEAALDDFKKRYLGEFAALPSNATVGFTIPNGAIISLANPSDDSLDGLYVRKGGQWVMASGVLPTEHSVFATAGQTNITVPGGYDPRTVQVYRNGRRQKIGPAPIGGETNNDCTASNGTSIVFPAATLALNDWIFVTWGRSFSVANITAIGVAFTGSGALAAISSVQAAIDWLEANKVSKSTALNTTGLLQRSRDDFGGDVTLGLPRALLADIVTGTDTTKVPTAKDVKDAIGALGASSASSTLASANSAASMSTLQLEFTGGFKFYELFVDGCEPTASGGASLLIWLATSGGASPSFYGGGSDYVHTGNRLNTAGTGGGWNSAGAGGIWLTGSQAQAAGNQGSFRVLFCNSGPGRYGSVKFSSYYKRTGGEHEEIQGHGHLQANSARWTHFRFTYASGSIASGMNYRLIGFN